MRSEKWMNAMLTFNFFHCNYKDNKAYFAFITLFFFYFQKRRGGGFKLMTFLTFQNFPAAASATVPLVIPCCHCASEEGRKINRSGERG